MKHIKLALLMLLMCPTLLFAQNEERRWAIDGFIGPTFIKDKTDITDPFGQRNGLAKYFGAEYYIPNTHFSARLGYQSESLYLGKQLIQAEQSTVNISGRYYPLPEHWFFQPHAGLGMNFLVSSDNSKEGYESLNGLTTSYTADIHSPRVAFTPTIGFDLYLLSSVALFVDYSYNLGINNKYSVSWAQNYTMPQTVTGNLNHHNLNIGLKVTFPFHFTSHDGSTMLQSIIGSLIVSRMRH